MTSAVSWSLAPAATRSESDAPGWWGRPERWMAILVLFVGGFNQALPDFSWARPVQLVHGIFVDNAIILAYTGLMLFSGRYRQLGRNSRAVTFAALVASLAVWGVMSAAVNGYSLLDIGKCLRLFMFSAFILLVVRWALVLGETFVLRTFVLGMAIGGLANLYYSLAYPELLVLTLPVLRSQNGAGGYLGISIGLGAWLMMVRRTSADRYVALAALLIGSFAAVISFSKTSMTIAACGLVAWGFVAVHSIARKRLGMVVVGILAVGGTTYALQTPTMAMYSDLAIRSIGLKFTNVDVSSKYSVGTRYQYFFAVGQILVEHPLFGMSYSGLYDGFTHTDAAASGEMADEDPEAGARGEVNPHNTFLYYAAAEGMPGLVIAMMIYTVFLVFLGQSLEAVGITGWGITLSLAMAYFLYGMTLPTMYDTDVVHLPAAVAIAVIARERAARRRRAGSLAPAGAG